MTLGIPNLFIVITLLSCYRIELSCLYEYLPIPFCFVSCLVMRNHIKLW